MSGEILYAPPERHWCETPGTPPGAVGAVWRCSGCGTYWRFDALPLMAFAAWHPMGRFAVRRFRRRQRKNGAREA